ncbi:hypothetical protein Hanom_Chr05g00419811 [Helianthus anomalus]
MSSPQLSPQTQAPYSNACFQELNFPKVNSQKLETAYLLGRRCQNLMTNVPSQHSPEKAPFTTEPLAGSNRAPVLLVILSVNNDFLALTRR